MATEIKDMLYYKKCFQHLTRSARKGEKAPHKPILLLAMIDRVESLINMGIAGGRMINQNLIDLNPKLEQFFYKHWNTYVTSEAFSPSFSTPFYHMESEPFWKLVLKKNTVPQGGQNESNLYKYYNGAQIDEDLMLLLLEDDSREELRQTLIKMIQSSDPELPLEEESASNPQLEEKSEELSNAFIQTLPAITSTATFLSTTESQDVMRKQFQDFMRQNGTSEGSVKKYSTLVANNADVRAIIKQLTGKDSLYLVTSPDEATKIRLAVKAAPCDIKGHHMYSVGISHYAKFLSSWNEQNPNQVELVIDTTEPQTSEPEQPEPVKEEPVKEGKKKIVGWSDEEMLLSLDLYFQLPYSQRTRRNPAVVELANLTGRTPASIVLRLANYLCFDIEEQKLGHKGMEGGLRQCKPFWDKYVEHKEQLHKEAEEIRKKIDPSNVVVIFDHAVDYSFFNYGCTLDKKFHQTIFDALGGRIERGQHRDVVFLYEDKEYTAQFENVNRHGVKSDTVRLMWKGNVGTRLSTYLQQKFPEYKTITELHNLHEHVPETLLHKAIFYKDSIFILKIE